MKCAVEMGSVAMKIDPGIKKLIGGGDTQTAW
jgi:hypothetical protein